MVSEASMHNAEQRRIKLRHNGYFAEKVQKKKTCDLPRLGAVQMSKHKFLFMISICSEQCNYSMKRHRFYCFISFAQDADIHMSGKRRNSTIGPKWEDNCLYNGQLSTSRCIKTVIIFQQHFVFNIEIKGSVKLFQKSGAFFRSSNNSKWQACMRETDADRSWQASHGEPWTSRRDEQGRSNARHSCLVRTLHSYSRGPGGAVLAHSSEREKSDSEGDASKVETQKKTEAQVFILTSAKNQKRSILRAEKYGDLTTAEHKILSEGCDSGNNHRCAVVVQVLAIQWNQCNTKTSQETEKNLRKFPEPPQKPKVIHENIFFFKKNWQVLWRIIMELSNNYTSSTRNKRNCRTSCTSSKRSDISRVIAIWIEW